MWVINRAIGSHRLNDHRRIARGHLPAVSPTAFLTVRAPTPGDAVRRRSPVAGCIFLWPQARPFAGWPEAQGEENKPRLFFDVELMNAYQKATHDYDSAKAGTGCRVKMFTSFLVAERVLASRLGTAGGATVGTRSN
jgi:hypothetical protein